MQERDEFSHFVIERDQAGFALAVFCLRKPEWHAEVQPDGSTVYAERGETHFDEPSLRIRIGNLKQQGLDASMSEAALSALRQVVTAERHGTSSEAGAFPLLAKISALALSPIAEITHDIVVVTTAGADLVEPVIAYVNPAFTRLTGYASHEAFGSRLSLLYGSGTDSEMAAAINTALAAGESLQAELLLHPKAGRPLWFDIRIAPLPAQGRLTHSVLAGRLAHPVGRGPYALESIAQRDELTGLFGQEVLLETIRAALQEPASAKNRAPCIAYIGIDGFAELKARYSRAVGDAILLGFADRLSENVRRADVLCCIGGPEFAVYMANIGLSAAKIAAERLTRMLLSSPIETPVGPMTVSVSIGVAEVRIEGPETEPKAILASVLEAGRGGLSHPVAAT